MKLSKKQPASFRNNRRQGHTCPYVCQLRTQKRRRGNHRLLILVLAVMIFLGMSTYIVAFSDAFEIKTVNVTGETRVNPESLQNEIKEVMQRQQGLLAGDNYFALNEKQIIEKILGAFPQIAEAKINRKFPGGLEVQVREKESKLLWCRANCFWVSADGEAYLPQGEEETIEGRLKVQETEKGDEVFNFSQTKSTTKATEAMAPTRLNTAASSAQKETAPAPKTKSGALNQGKNIPNGTRTIALRKKVADGAFVQAVLDIAEKIGNNRRLQVERFETANPANRELVLVSQEGTRVYFDTTKDLDIQIGNLNYLLQQQLKPEEISHLSYIYLKNTDRVFYK